MTTRPPIVLNGAELERVQSGDIVARAVWFWGWGRKKNLDSGQFARGWDSQPSNEAGYPTIRKSVIRGIALRTKKNSTCTIEIQDDGGTTLASLSMVAERTKTTGVLSVAVAAGTVLQAKCTAGTFKKGQVLAELVYVE